MKTPENDTISAIITPPGEGGIAVLRLSGPQSIPIVGELFEGNADLKQVQSQTVHFGHLKDSEGSLVDEVLVTIFRAPHSYTTEDIVEISCHGSTFISRKILDLMVSKGARLAEPGEFTRRAYLNGRLDLSQAEAVADLIQADSRASHTLALSQLQGTLSGKISELRKEIVDLCSLVELELDFSEEGLEIIGRDKMISRLLRIRNEISQLVDSYEHGKIHREGLRIVLAGAPNVGKSSILNSLMKESRAIVTDVSGTTRDTIEESILVAGARFTIVDTAGLRETDDVVEEEGIKRTKVQIEHADLILLVIDPTNELTIEEDMGIIDSYLKGKSHKEIVIVFNKSDLLTGQRIQALEEKYVGYKTVVSSTKTQMGIEDLERVISKMAEEGRANGGGEGIIISNLRQQETLKKACESLDLAIEGARKELSGDLLSVDLKAALSSLSGVVGDDISEEVLNNVFLRFCIGK